ncbi:Uncharacterized protein BM_BM7312 [Brugia malayi]|uniref:C3H1-type domain-containing protein n=1 Tax=Brugia malayi TaxID=6279 RepID=A0A4E9FU60_BRUMA|nr:Uncharacterized protein BM_BM7312 [Brugia malayi]VIO99421.1 Uncharacterized protein BM_BM7312 [Brugia malayi]
MAAVVHSKKEEQDLWAQQFSMVPMAMEFWDFLYQTYGIERHMTYFNQEDPNRMYFITHGKLNYIDLSRINPNFSRTFEKRSLAPSEDSKRPIRPCKSVWQALTDVERKEFQKERSKKRSYKTSLCKTFRETKKCVYGDACIFAHGERELRLPPQIHPKYKTQLCRNFSKWNYCPYGAKCLFIHERSYENVDFTNIRTDDSASINNFSYANSFDVEQMNTKLASENLHSLLKRMASVTLQQALVSIEQKIWDILQSKINFLRILHMEIGQWIMLLRLRLTMF